MEDGRELLRAFGAAVRERRLAMSSPHRDRPMSQEELAEVAGVHRTYLGDIERGERNVALLNLHRLARALRVPMADLMADTEARLRRRRR